MTQPLRFAGVLLAGLIATTVLCPVLWAAESQRITLLHTSDLHGSVLAWDDFRDQPANGSIAQVATLVTDVRESSTHPVLVLDSGDTIQGTPLEQFAHIRWSEPSPTIAAMNHVGYDAMAVGNHEFNFGLDVLRRAQNQADFPFLSANTIDTSTGKTAFPPYRIVRAGEVTVGILGLVTPNIPGWERPEHYRGLIFRPMDEVAREQVVYLREKEGCDLVVVLAHTGFEKDLDDGSPSNTEVEDWAWRLAQVEGIDVLLTGHTHTDIPPRMITGTIVSQPRARARLLTRIDLEFAKDAEGWKVASWDGRNIPLEGVAGDPILEQSMADLHRRVAEALDGPVGEISRGISVAGCRLRDCAASDLIHQVQLEASGAELSLSSLLTDRTPDLAAGSVTWRWIYSFYVYPNTLVKVTVTGAQVVDILEHAARYYQGMDCSPDGVCAVLTDPSIPHYNVDTMAGLSYRVDPTLPVGDRVHDVRVAGRSIELDREFTLVCNNYRAAGGGGYPHLAEAEPVWQSSEEMTDLIGDFLARKESWQPEIDGNWWLGPAVIAEEPASATQ